MPLPRPSPLTAEARRHAAVDRAVERWHVAPEGKADMPLNEYLGWTWDEYAAYAERDELPPKRKGAK